VAAPGPQEWRKLLGRKVSLRARNPGSDGHPFTEAIGMVQSVAADDQGFESVVVVNRRGEARSIRIDDVLVAKIL
jgi:ribosome maturation factor RimP